MATGHSIPSMRSDVLYFSTHQYPYYPGTGFFTRRNGAGKGFTVNVPLNAGPGDAEYFLIFEEILEPIALEFKPDIVFVSAGFDIYYRDPWGHAGHTPGVQQLGQGHPRIRQQTCEGRVIFVLEEDTTWKGLRDSAREVLKTMRGEILARGRDEEVRKQADHRLIDPVIKKVKEAQKPYWKIG